MPSPRRASSAPGAVLALVVLATLPWVPGCLFQNASPTVRLRDSVVMLNSDLRWGRMDLAVSLVAPSYQRRFVRAREGWGERIQIADTDVRGVRVTAEEDGAISTVTFRWYSQETFTIRQTELQQRWELIGRDYFLAEEVITGGDGSLLRGVKTIDPMDALPGGEDEEATPESAGEPLPTLELDS